jgi:hypothetical protein
MDIAMFARPGAGGGFPPSLLSFGSVGDRHGAAV